MAFAHYVTLAILTSYVALVQAGFGTSYGLVLERPYSNYFKNVSITMRVPDPPDTQTDFLYLWPGIDLGSPLFQPVVASFADPRLYGCDADPYEWCLWPFVYGPGDMTQESIKTPVKTGDILDMVIEYNGDNQGYNQRIMRAGEVIGNLDGGAGDGQAHRFQTTVECPHGVNGVTPAHVYTNIVLTLGSVDLDFNISVNRYPGNVTVSDLYTDDKGLTWKIDAINMQPSECQEGPAPTETTGPSTIASSTTNEAILQEVDIWSIFAAFCLGLLL